MNLIEGQDVGAKKKSKIDLINEFKSQGKVIMISSEMPEILGIK